MRFTPRALRIIQAASLAIILYGVGAGRAWAHDHDDDDDQCQEMKLTPLGPKNPVVGWAEVCIGKKGVGVTVRPRKLVPRNVYTLWFFLRRGPTALSNAQQMWRARFHGQG
jgi:hypothetical protein